MANPNLINASTISDLAGGLALTTSAQDLLTNPAASGKVMRVATVRAANVDGASDATVTLNFVDASPSQTIRLAYQVSVPAGAALQLVTKEDAIKLNEGDKLTALASAAGDIELYYSLEEITDA